MRCGSKCFTVEYELAGETKKIPVTARTSAEARKTIRKEFGDQAAVRSVTEGKK